MWEKLPCWETEHCRRHFHKEITWSVHNTSPITQSNKAQDEETSQSVSPANFDWSAARGTITQRCWRLMKRLAQSTVPKGSVPSAAITPSAEAPWEPEWLTILAHTTETTETPQGLTTDCPAEDNPVATVCWHTDDFPRKETDDAKQRDWPQKPNRQIDPSEFNQTLQSVQHPNSSSCLCPAPGHQCSIHALNGQWSDRGTPQHYLVLLKDRLGAYWSPVR